MQRSDEGKCIYVEGRTLFRLRTLIGWWWYRCLFFDDCRHHKLISLTRELASPRVSLPYSAKCAPVLLSIEELLGVRKRPPYLLDFTHIRPRRAANEGDESPSFSSSFPRERDATSQEMRLRPFSMTLFPSLKLIRQNSGCLMFLLDTYHFFSWCSRGCEMVRYSLMQS